MLFDNKQTRLLLGILVIVTALVAIVYFAFLRVPMVPAYQNIRESDASAIVAAFDRADIPYRLENDGHDILVPEDKVAQARVLIAGSNLPVGGTVGFELFNDSDMGLTEFAQKINFQRAMQGELARTIMSMEGVKFARVHLALPDRTIFRAEQGEPTAAVTLQMAPGTLLTRERIAGVRQLVASSVPNLAAGSVVILDERGDLVSGVPAPDNGYGSPLTARGALEQFYQTVAHQAIARVLPNGHFEVTVNARRTVAAGADWSEDKSDAPDRRNVVLSVLVRTQSELETQDREAAETVLADALRLDRTRGDTLVFSLGLTNAETTVPLTPVPAFAEPPTNTSMTAPDDWVKLLFTRWTLIAIVILGLIALVLRPRRRLDDQEAENFGELLRTATSSYEPTDAR